MTPPAERKIKLGDMSVKNLQAGRTWDAETGGAAPTSIGLATPHKRCGGSRCCTPLR